MLLERYLKSNMDRFIGSQCTSERAVVFYLKSNMDRFIEAIAFAMMKGMVDLKSNMDRFIADGERSIRSSTSRFKIQYG